MRTRFQTITTGTTDIADFADDVRRIFRELEQPGELPAGECSPPIDVRETDNDLEVVLDLPGVGLEAVRVVARGQLLLIAGEKRPRRGGGDSSFHLVERDFGRFARVVRLPVACETAKASALLTEGELRITLPRVKERRGRAIDISITQAP
ncbi:MAG: Hsp20/alpha crystallin family protein [Vicinamibacterales bacterium]